MVLTPSNLQSYLQSLAQTISRFVCHQNESQTSTLCLTSPRCNIDTLNISWEGLDGYAFFPVALIPKVIQKMNNYRCKMIVVVPGWPRMHWFWYLVNLSIRNPITATSLASSVETAIQTEIPPESVVSEPSCLAPRNHSESVKSFSEQMSERIKAPQRPSPRKLYKSRWAIFELRCQQNKVVNSEPTISDFLTHLFTT